LSCGSVSGEIVCGKHAPLPCEARNRGLSPELAEVVVDVLGRDAPPTRRWPKNGARAVAAFAAGPQLANQASPFPPQLERRLSDDEVRRSRSFQRLRQKPPPEDPAVSLPASSCPAGRRPVGIERARRCRKLRAADIFHRRRTRLDRAIRRSRPCGCIKYRLHGAHSIVMTISAEMLSGAEAACRAR
jgi:hypothetical protein